MTDREKLIELLNETFDKQYDRSLVITARNTADYLLANGVTFVTDNNVGGKWIAVTERLPNDDNERVLVFTRGNMPIGNQRMDTDRYRRGEWVRYGGNVTHWMPLPKPPKEE